MVYPSYKFQYFFRRPCQRGTIFNTLLMKSLKGRKRIKTGIMKSFESFVVVSTLISLLAFKGATASEKWMQLSATVAFKSVLDPANENAQMIRAKNVAIDRMLSSTEKSTDFYSSGYSLGLEDMNKDWDDSQMAWHLLGFYVDCSKNQGQKNGRRNRGLQDNHNEDNHDNGGDEEANKTCTRYVMYAVYVDRNYQGGGLGEYKFYDQSSGEYKCYSGNCRANMDCHSSSSSTWELLGIFKIDNISEGDGWMEQLFKHAGVCYWGWDNYGFASEMRQLLPNGCKKTDYVANGTNLYLDVKPSVNASLSLALYTDNSCSKLYTGSGNFDVYGVVGTSKSDMGYFNYLLNGYKTCQPCIAYNLTDGDFTCKDDAGYTNCRQCMKFAIKAKSSVASPQEIKLAYRQSGMLPVASITNQLEMTGLKEVEAEFLSAPPKYLELAVLIFLGCVTFYFIPTGSAGSVQKKNPLLDDGSTGTEDRSGSDYSNSPPLSPSGIIVDCDPMRGKSVPRRLTQHSGTIKKSNAEASDSDGQNIYEYSETDVSVSDSERYRLRREALEGRLT